MRQISPYAVIIQLCNYNHQNYLSSVKLLAKVCMRKHFVQCTYVLYCNNWITLFLPICENGPLNYIPDLFFYYKQFSEFFSSFNV
jgi:hypothetical protein